MTHLFLSPHYDDAVYSCGGLIYQLTQQGKSVIVITLMAGEPSLPLPDTPVLGDNHLRWQLGENPVMQRRREDQNAAQILGAQTLYNDTLDCIYRTANGEALYPSEASLWGDIHPDDPAPSQLRALGLAFEDVDCLYAPLAVGSHVDHRIARDWALWLSERHPALPLRFYEDYPYTRSRSAVQSALKSLPPMQRLTTSLSEDDIMVKINAMSAYESQISTFWGEVGAVANEVRRTFTNPEGSGYVEYCWKLR